MRRALALFLLLAILPGTVVRDAPTAPDWEAPLRVLPVALDAAARQPVAHGALRLVEAWQLQSGHPLFGGYSAMVVQRPGHALLVSDAGHFLRLALGRHASRLAPRGQGPRGLGFGTFSNVTEWDKAGRDAESTTLAPASGAIWIGWEGRNAISRHRPDLTLGALVRPRAMRGWPLNSGAEAMVRLADGRFIVLSEAYPGRFDDVHHEALLFPGDPTEGAPPIEFVYAGDEDFRPTDMAQLPDGRVLILMRELRWPFPARFAGRIELADPRTIAAGGTWQGRTIARIESPWPVDNYEGIAIIPRSDGKVDVWLVSDDNGAALQRTLLLRLELDPSRLQ